MSKLKLSTMRIELDELELFIIYDYSKGCPGNNDTPPTPNTIDIKSIEYLGLQFSFEQITAIYNDLWGKKSTVDYVLELISEKIEEAF